MFPSFRNNQLSNTIKWMKRHQLPLGLGFIEHSFYRDLAFEYPTLSKTIKCPLNRERSTYECRIGPNDSDNNTASTVLLREGSVNIPKRDSHLNVLTDYECPCGSHNICSSTLSTTIEIDKTLVRPAEKFRKKATRFCYRHSETKTHMDGAFKALRSQL